MSTVTVTAKQGTGNTITAKVIPNVTDFRVDTVRKMLFVNQGNDRQEFDINAATTVTCTIANGQYTLTIS